MEKLYSSEKVIYRMIQDLYCSAILIPSGSENIFFFVFLLLQLVMESKPMGRKLTYEERKNIVLKNLVECVMEKSFRCITYSLDPFHQQ